MSDIPFKYVAGNPALDLVNTVDWTARRLEHERLQNFERLTRWAEGAGVLSLPRGSAMRKLARSRPGQAEAAYRRALALRELLQRLFCEAARGRVESESLKEFNRTLGRALEHMEVIPRSPRVGQFQLGWEESTDPDSLLWPVLWSAALLLASPEVTRIRICGGQDCGWMYVDRSRNRLRRWCQMETCGTREKTRRRLRR